jgi:hypothetical protein
MNDGQIHGEPPETAMKRPVGSAVFDFTIPPLFKNPPKKLVIFEQIAGAHYFGLHRDAELLLHYFHSSPGTGTREAVVDLKQISESEKIRIIFTWNPDEITIDAVTRVDGEVTSVSGNSAESPVNVRIGKDGNVYWSAKHGETIMQLQLNVGGQEVLHSSAIETWHETLSAVDVLDKGESSDGFLFETVMTNMILSSLVTGFEAYMKKRFEELDAEGVEISEERLLEFVCDDRDQPEHFKAEFFKRAEEQSITLVQLTNKERRINFQEYKTCKRVFRDVYGLTIVGDQISSELVSRIKEYISYRHRIVHVSPMASVWNWREMPTKPVIPSKQIRSEVVDSFKAFIEGFHSRTLELCAPS